MAPVLYVAGTIDFTLTILMVMVLGIAESVKISNQGMALTLSRSPVAGSCLKLLKKLHQL